MFYEFYISMIFSFQIDWVSIMSTVFSSAGVTADTEVLLPNVNRLYGVEMMLRQESTDADRFHFFSH